MEKKVVSIAPAQTAIVMYLSVQLSCYISCVIPGGGVKLRTHFFEGLDGFGFEIILGFMVWGLWVWVFGKPAYLA